MRISKRELISIIQNTESFNNPKVQLEQYCIDANCAVDILYYAGFENNDINNALVVDLGAGTGRLSIASAFFNAHYIISVDNDIKALNILKKNIHNLELSHIIFPVCADIEFFGISHRYLSKSIQITTIMNPPFGVQTRFADRFFLKKAFEFSNIVYSIHLANEKVNKFISTYINNLGWKIDNIVPFTMILEKKFPFHTQKTKKIKVNIYRFLKK
ncbi:MAG: METTL5 family protein [Promethearchaeota archaeon]